MERFEKTSKEMHIYFPVVNEDTISRQWLLECLTARGLKFDTEKDENIFIHLVRDIAPPAQPERKKGRWIDDGKGFYMCSSCVKRWVHWWARVVPPDQMCKELRYCPMCSADMRGESDGRLN